MQLRKNDGHGNEDTSERPLLDSPDPGAVDAEIWDGRITFREPTLVLGPVRLMPGARFWYNFRDEEDKRGIPRPMVTEVEYTGRPS